VIKRALISVYKKDGLIELARELHRREIEIVSSGGTRKALSDNGIPNISVSEITDFPEILDGRVKTLHPKIFGGILHTNADQHLREIEEYGLKSFDLIIVNLYPFEETIAQKDCTLDAAIEKIDIGGPSLIRAAAKNYFYKTVIITPDQYHELLNELDQHNNDTSLDFRKKCAVQAFQHAARYNAIIADYLKDDTAFPQEFTIQGKLIQELRYGENPHQTAAFYSTGFENPLDNFEKLQGKELSYNNILDLDAALSMVHEFDNQPFVTILKHNNPCGAAQGSTQLATYKKALASDPISAFGGIVGFNTRLEGAVAEEMRSHFFECILAPDFDPAAMEILTKKKNLRLIRYAKPANSPKNYQLRSVHGGFLVQNADDLRTDLKKCKIVSKRKPTEEELSELDFAWRMVKHVHSNAIVFAKDNQLIGVGAGQMSRVDSAELAINKANVSGNPTADSVVGSDAFFPFRDGVDVIAKAGARAIVQPGGSVRDEEVITAADEHDLVMIFTGNRHFKH